MNIKQFSELHRNLKISVPKTKEFNPLPSATDPTQDIPIKAIQITASGIPINVKEYKSVMSGVKVENFTSIEKRNCDVFDNLGELQEISQTMNKNGVTTNFVKPKKQKPQINN